MSTQAQAVPGPQIAAEDAAAIAALLPSPNPEPATLDEKIENATVQAGAIASIFNPVVGHLIACGAAIEPIIFSFTSLIAALFKHHTKPAAPKA